VEVKMTVGQARQELRARRLSARELTETVLAQVERLNPRLRAYLHVDAEGPLEQARAADGPRRDLPLAGIPVCVKDVINVAGMPTTAGAARWRRSPDRDALAVSRLRDAGAVVIGKGHTNEFAYGIDGQNPHWGNCCNPYDLKRLCGGSSSGPAVAAASGMALAGLGTDTSGSLRAPASFCGLIGLRPTLGAVPRDGVVPLAWSYDTVGPLTTCVEDAALLLAVLTADHTPATVEPTVRGLRLGLLEQHLELVEPYVAEGVTRAAEGLEARGARIEPLRLRLLDRAPAIHYVVQHVEAARIHRPWFDWQRDHYSDPVRTRLEVGRLLPASAYLAAQQARRLLIDEVASSMRGLDACLAPTMPLVAPEQGLSAVTIRGARHPLRPALLTCVLLPSQLTCPAISLPVGEHEGLPYGMQVFGRPFSEGLLLRIAAACERRYAAPTSVASSL
jgi:aspartyl-tRNA(Asn)/glutamyl-tRNA(Gln) amidotransferase subunit A